MASTYSRILHNAAINSATTVNSAVTKLENRHTSFLLEAQVTRVAGDTCDIQLQHSGDGVVWFDVPGALLAFTTSSGNQIVAVNSATMPNLLQYVRVRIVTTGASVNYTPLVKLWMEDVK